MVEDVVAKCMGNFGKWQLRTILIIFLCKIPTSWFMAVVIYTAPSPQLGEYWCRPPANFHPNSSIDWIRAVHPPRPIDDHHPGYQYDVCHVYADVMEAPEKYVDFIDNDSGMNRTIIPCVDFVFHSDFHSLIAEFNLVCKRSLLLNLSQCFHIGGLLCGGIIAYMLLKMYKKIRFFFSNIVIH